MPRPSRRTVSVRPLEVAFSVRRSTRFHTQRWPRLTRFCTVTAVPAVRVSVTVTFAVRLQRPCARQRCADTATDTTASGTGLTTGGLTTGGLTTGGLTTGAVAGQPLTVPGWDGQRSSSAGNPSPSLSGPRGVASQASPYASPSALAWLALTVVGQSSELSGTPSPSAS